MPRPRLDGRVLVSALLPLLVGSASPGHPLHEQVEVIRTAHGVPHIRAASLQGAGFGLAWVQLEDYGDRTAMNLLRQSGRMGRLFGRDSLEYDVASHFARLRAAATWNLLEPATRDVYEGFAAGVNRYVAMHRGDFVRGMPTNFRGQDVLALDVIGMPQAKVRAFVARLRNGTVTTPVVDPEEGSNAWALAPSRSRSGHAMLLRNPHLNWNAGYYEAHVTVPGVLDFYGDFRIGGPFTVISGFNANLGWATTNNAQDLDEVYVLQADPARPDHYLFDGGSHPLQRESATVTYRQGNGTASERRERWSTPMGPVIHRDGTRIYVIKSAGYGEYRAGEQFLRMMRATSLAEWQDAMRMRARMTSNFTYADRAGNIYYLWNAAIPRLPHPPGGDTVAFPASRTADVWNTLVPFEELPQLLNPPGGYLHQENSSHHFTNLRAVFDTVNRYANLEAPSLSLRSQLAIALIGGNDTLTLEEMLERKHDTRMLLADRVRPALVQAIRATRPAGDVAEALALLERWDGRASVASRGAVLFESWWNSYAQGRADTLRFARNWSAADPVGTPAGLRDPVAAAAAFAQVAASMRSRFGGLDVAWGDVHRVRRGAVDVPVGGCSGAMGCFRTLGFTRAADGKRVASVGDAWILGVEFGPTPRALSVLAYGQSPDSASPWHADQAAMFARGELKRVLFAERDVDAGAVRRYRPGEP